MPLKATYFWLWLWNCVETGSQILLEHQLAKKQAALFIRINHFHVNNSDLRNISLRKVSLKKCIFNSGIFNQSRIGLLQWNSHVSVLSLVPQGMEKHFSHIAESVFDPNKANGQEKKSSRDMSDEKLNVLKLIIRCRNVVVFLVGNGKQNKLDQLPLSLQQPLQLVSTWSAKCVSQVESK